MKRRDALRTGAGLAALLLVRPAASAPLPAELAAAVRAYAGDAPVKEGRVRLDIAELIDNGNAVPVAVSVESPMTATDHVVAIAIFNEKNPQRDVVRFQLGARAGKARVATRIRLATSQKLVALAKMRDGSIWSHTVDVIVTLAACIEDGEDGAMARSLITVPKTARRGDIIEIRALIQYPMETGYRPGADGKLLPRDLIRRFSCRYDDGVSNEVVFSAELFAAVAANPLISFFTTATASGTLNFLWEGDNGFVQRESAAISVT